MSNRNFMHMIEDQWARSNFVCVGLDSDFDKIPDAVCEICYSDGSDVEGTIFSFNESIVAATKDIVCAYKPNIAFYEAHGNAGLNALYKTIKHIHKVAPLVPVILDAKRADIGNTNNGYVEFAFDYLGADAITVHPYLGEEALQPFLSRKDKGIFVLCRTSNPGAGELQGIKVLPADTHGFPEEMVRGSGHGIFLYQYVAVRVAQHWNKNSNCGLVVGATYPYELREVRGLVGNMPILIPGIGAQGGDLEKTVLAGRDSCGKGIIVNSSRGIIFASEGEDFAEAARRETEKLRNLINQYRQ